MKKTTSIGLLITGLALAGVSRANAQASSESSAFIDINGGAQPQSRTLETTESSPLYGETLVVNSAQAIGSGGLFDISAGYHVKPRFAIAVGFSWFFSEGDGNVAASIPDPVVFNRAKVVNASATGLNRSEFGTHVMAVWFIPAGEKLDIAVSVGPSFIRLKQDTMDATVPAGTQNLNVATVTETATAFGANAGINVNYLFTPRYGVGVFVRYAGGTVDLETATGVRVGGVQLGGGLRFRF